MLMVLNFKKDAKYFANSLTKKSFEEDINKSKNRWALITGASGGIGSSYAMQLAGMGFNLFLTSNKNSSIELNFLKETISKKFSVSVKTLSLDLSIEKDIDKLILSVKKIKNLTILINCAGFGLGDDFLNVELKHWMKMIQLHNIAVVKLSHSLIPELLKQKKSYLINVSSLAGFFPMKNSSIYSASKSFLINFSETLHLELKNKGLKVQALCPGFVRTTFFQKSLKANVLPHRKMLFWMKPDAVVKKSIMDLKNKKNKVICIPGFPNRFIFFICSLIPKRLYYFLFRKK